MWSRTSHSRAVAAPAAPSCPSWPAAAPAACVALALLAYRELLALPEFASLGDALVFWLFEPSDTWPPLVLAGSAWLLYRRRDAWSRLPSRRGAALPALLLLGLGAGLFVWAWLTGARDLLVPSLMANALGLAWLARGARGARVVLLPVLFLGFAWPLPPPLLNEVVWQLQLWTAAVAGALLRAVGVPALVETTVVSRPDFSFAFIERCSGFRGMELLGAIALLVRERVRGAGARSWLVVLAAPPLAALLNLLRVFVVTASPDPDAVNDHLVQGVLVLALGTLLLLACARKLAARRAGVVAACPRRPAGAALPWRRALAGLLALCVVGLLPAPRRSAASWLDLRERIPVERDGWVSTPRRRDAQFLGAVRFRESLGRLYTRGDESVALFVAAAGGAERGTSPFSPKTLLPGMRWRLERSGAARIEALGVDVESAVVERDGRRWLAYHWRLGDAGLLAETLRHALALDAAPWAARRERLVLWLATPLGAARAADRARAAHILEGFARDFRGFLSDPRRPTASAARSARPGPV